MKNKVGVLHVRIIAPVDVRIKRIMKSEGLSREDALKLVEENDKAVAEYLTRFYNINWRDQLNYDMVLNTEKMDVSTASKVIASAVSQSE